jgi:putative ABC transport system permease protein
MEPSANRISEWIADFGRDLRIAGRHLRRAPGFTLVAVLTISLGIGATTTIYSAVHSLLLAPLPYRGADRLVHLDETLMTAGIVGQVPTTEIVDAWRARSHTLEGIVAFAPSQWMRADPVEPELVGGERIEPDLIRFLGSRPLLGRVFLQSDTEPGVARVALLSEALWRRRYGARSDIIGRMIVLDGQPFTIVGVMPTDFGKAVFRMTDPLQVFVPLVRFAARERVEALARLRPGATAEEASRELSAIPTRDAQAGPNHVPGGHAYLIRESFFGRYQETLTLLLGAVGFVLLIACANVANLLLTRAWSRQREFGIRTAMGAGRGRLVRQVLTESVALSVAGGVLGSFLAWRAIPVLAALRPSRLGALDEVHLDTAVLAATFGLAVVTGVLFGLAPALFATAGQISDSLKEGARSTPGRGWARFRGALVVSEIALSMVLLISAGLLLRSLIAGSRALGGLYPAGLVSVSVELPTAAYPTPTARAQVFDRVLGRASRIPGVDAAGLAIWSPWVNGMRVEELVVEGGESSSGQPRRWFAYNAVSPGYFRTAEIPLLAGTIFSGDSSERAVVVSGAFARQHLTGSWLGARLRFGASGPWLTVVGVVGDVQALGGAGAYPQPALYEPFGARRTGTILARGTHPAALLPFVTRAVAAIDPAIHVLGARTTSTALAAMQEEPRFVMTLLSAFAALALVLATVGLYGVVAYSVRQRTHEIGVRVALGAEAGDVVGMLLGQGLGLALAGMVLGVAGAAVATRLLRSRLYQVGPGDPITFVFVGVVLAMVALVASFLPARAALRVDPVEALRVV